jgi:hypothetical protein
LGKGTDLFHFYFIKKQAPMMQRSVFFKKKRDNPRGNKRLPTFAQPFFITSFYLQTTMFSAYQKIAIFAGSN